MTKEEYYRKQNTPAGRREIVTKLLNLTKDDGWHIIRIVLEEEATALQNRINNIENTMSGEDLQKDRIRLYYVRDLLSMPEDLALNISNTSEDKVIKSVY